MTSQTEAQCLLPAQSSRCDWLIDDDVTDEESSDEDLIEQEKCDVTKQWDENGDVDDDNDDDDNDDDDDSGDSGDAENSRLLKKHLRLKLEAKMALAQVESMARMQIEVEKKCKKKSPIAEIVGMPNFGLTNKFRLTLDRLKWMKTSELQLITNDILSQIEELNKELVGLLEERDDLYMEQDAILIDIEDQTRSQKDEMVRSKSMNR